MFGDVILRDAAGAKVQRVVYICSLLVDMMEKMLGCCPVAFHGFSIMFLFSFKINNPLYKAWHSVLKPNMRKF